MNREQRRRLRVLVAEKVCQLCGSPICPACDVETGVCECCGEFSCDICRAYVLPPVVSLS